MKELRCVSCCVRAFAICLDSLFKAFMCLASMFTSLIVAVPKRDLDRSPLMGAMNVYFLTFVLLLPELMYELFQLYCLSVWQFLL